MKQFFLLLIGTLLLSAISVSIEAQTRRQKNVIEVSADGVAWWQYAGSYPSYDLSVIVRNKLSATEVGELTVAKGTLAQSYTTYGFNGDIRWRTKYPNMPDLLKEFLSLHGHKIPSRLWELLKETFPNLQKPIGWVKVIRPGYEAYYESSCGTVLVYNNHPVFHARGLEKRQPPEVTKALKDPIRFSQCIKEVGNLPASAGIVIPPTESGPLTLEDQILFKRVMPAEWANGTPVPEGQRLTPGIYAIYGTSTIYRINGLEDRQQFSRTIDIKKRDELHRYRLIKLSDYNATGFVRQVSFQTPLYNNTDLFTSITPHGDLHELENPRRVVHLRIALIQVGDKIANIFGKRQP